MKKLLSLFLALVIVLGILPTATFAAGGEEEALGEVNIYNGEHELGYPSINGAVKKQIYTYFLYERNNSQMKEAPTYCVNPTTPGVSQTVGPGESIKYLAEGRASKRKVMQKHGKTELGKYSDKYALSELLVCGECGTPYKRCTWARNGKKRIVWRCVSRLEFGTKYCHHSPTLDEDKLHRVIVEALNEFAQTENEVKEDVLNFTHMAWTGLETGGGSLVSLKQRLSDITAEQATLLDKVLDAETIRIKFRYPGLEMDKKLN